MTHDHDPPELPDDPELERATRDLLRNDPLEIDLHRRERAIDAALGAGAELTAELTQRDLTERSLPGAGAPPRSAPVSEVVPLKRRRARRDTLRPVLVAAAAILAIATGVFATVELGDSGSEDMAATGATADDIGTNDLGTSDEAGESFGSDSSPDAAAGSGSSDATEQDAFAPTTTAPTTAEPTAALIALGDHRDADALLDAAQRNESLDRAREEHVTASRPAPTPPSATLPCEVELADRGATPFATATVAGAPVVLAVVPDGATVVLQEPGCAEIARR